MASQPDLRLRFSIDLSHMALLTRGRCSASPQAAEQPNATVPRLPLWLQSSYKGEMNRWARDGPCDPPNADQNVNIPRLVLPQGFWASHGRSDEASRLPQLLPNKLLPSALAQDRPRYLRKLL